MKLSELVNYKNVLDTLSTSPAQLFTNSELTKLTHLTNNADLDQKLISINQSFDEFNKKLSEIKQDLKLEIEKAERPWFKLSYELYEGELHSAAEDILKLRNRVDPNEEFFHSRLKLYSNWQHAALIIRPGLKSFVNDMVAFDPLYLVDLSHDYLLPAIAKFNEQYQNRLRTYTIKEEFDQPILDKLPDEQFGLCLAYDYFNFRPFEIIKKYFAEVYQKLKPGGAFIITFNDCDRSSAVKLVESYYSCYTPGYLMRELATTMGFKIVYSWHDAGPTTWLELKKPGTLTSIKGGQSLGKIVQK